MKKRHGALLLLLVFVACDTAAEDAPLEDVTVAGAWLARYNLFRVDVCSPCEITDELVLEDDDGVLTGTAQRAYIRGEADSITFDVTGTRSGVRVLLSLIKAGEHHASFAGDLAGEKLLGTYELLDGDVFQITGFERLP